MEKYYDHFIGGECVAPREKSDYQAMEKRPGSPVQVHVASGTDRDGRCHICLPNGYTSMDSQRRIIRTKTRMEERASDSAEYRAAAE